MKQDIVIRNAGAADDEALWAMLEPVFRAGDTYSIDADISREAALSYWCGPGRTVFVAEIAGRAVGSYYLVRNQGGGGSHVCNCGFVTGQESQGKGVARIMLDHALHAAVAAGFRAMQFNFVVSTNSRAIDIWQHTGFEIVGRLPGAFLHLCRAMWMPW